MSTEELWMRFLAHGSLTPEEKRALLKAMESDPVLRQALMADAEVDGLLRASGAGEQDAEGFVRAISDFLSAEKDASGFVSRVESRLEKEGILPSPRPSGEKGETKFRAGFGKPESMQYNSSRNPMPAIVNLEGSEEDFARLLVFHKIITKEQLQKALEARQAHAAQGGGLEPLRDTLLRTKIVYSALMFDVLRVASKVVEQCTKCNAVHHITYYHPHSRYFCTFCNSTMRVTDAGQSTKWQPGELPASVAEISSTSFPELPEDKPAARVTKTRPAPAPTGTNPLDDPSAHVLPAVPPPPLLKPAGTAPPPDNTVTVLPNVDETMLDFGDTPRTSSKTKPLPKLPPNDPPPAPTPAAPTAGAEGLPSWMDQDESMLDMGAVKPAKNEPAPLPPLPPPDPSITMAPGGGETMLGMGDTPRSSSKPKPLPKLPKADQPADPGAAAIDPASTLTPGLGGGTTMLDMGVGAKATPPLDPNASIVPGMGGGETMLDMGPTSGVTPPKKKIGDMTTSILGSKRAIPLGVPKPPPETPSLPAGTISNPSYDVTTKQGTTKTDATFMMTPPTGTQGTTVDRTQIQQTTPKTGMGGPGAAIANAKALPPEVAQASKDPARVFGKYILMSELGRGGAGVVYKAWDTLLLQYVALKFIRNQDDGESDSTSGSSQIEEFQREARMSVRLRHPNIVRIYELGCMSNRYYLSMEYIEGGNLLALIHGGKDRNQKTKFNSDPLKFIKIMQNIAMAVDYAHNSKPPIIHRDLKPHNVLVDTRGNPYVVDFGLAKEVDSGDGATLTGVVKGTPTYMAPEQAEGRNRDIDARTDVYSLGAILYEMLTGRPPFLGESVPEILRKIATDLPERPNDVITRTAIQEAASSTANSKTKTKPLLVPKPLETICLKALEKAKPDRYQSARELAEDIERYLKDEDILAQEPGLYRRIRRQVRRRPILSGALAAILLASVTGAIVAKATSKPVDTSRQDLITGIVIRGDTALKRQVKGRLDPDWEAVKVAASDLAGQDRNHPKIAEFEKAYKEHKELVEKTEREWSLALDRIRREPLSQVIGSLRALYKRCPELEQKFTAALQQELFGLKDRVLAEATRLYGTGARPAWVEDILKNSARETKDQADMLVGLAKDPDFPYDTVERLPDNPDNPDAPKTQDRVKKAAEQMAQIIAYQGTWTLQVNVAPFAEVVVLREEKELTKDYTPAGFQELEVVGSSYFVELCWPSRENPQVKVKEEIKDLHHGQTVVIRGDLSKATLKQERR